MKKAIKIRNAFVFLRGMLVPVKGNPSPFPKKYRRVKNQNQINQERKDKTK